MMNGYIICLWISLDEKHVGMKQEESWQERFNKLLETARKYHRLNQYA